MEYCALCSQPFSASDSSRKYRKLLYGKSCSKELAILNSLIFTTWPGLSVNSFEKLCEDEAYLCAPCQKGLINYNKALLKVNQLSSNLLSNLSVPSQTGPTSRPRTGDKRSAETANLEEAQESNGATVSSSVYMCKYVPNATTPTDFNHRLHATFENRLPATLNHRLHATFNTTSNCK